MRGRLFWIVLFAAVFVLLVALAGREGRNFAGLDTGGVGLVVYYLIWLVAIGAAIAVMFRRQLGRALRMAAIWLAIALALMLLYTYRAELRDVSDRVMAELVPGRPASRGVRVVEIVRGRGGDFRVQAEVNGVRVPMVLDTGASAVVLTQEAAKAVGLPIDVLVYNVTVDTANGRTRAAAVTLDRVAVGDVVERAVPALIAQPGQLRTSLLGMSFLNRLESFEVRGDRVLMRGYP
ncbi:MAG TPA: TIGR02281 family clan AA aspartic protease [Xanthobacteraceae bacterium]|nr:TIGR02281 family clan AA aspartic protease [Xanthobacteraceae bacterium]